MNQSARPSVRRWGLVAVLVWAAGIVGSAGCDLPPRHGGARGTEITPELETYLREIQHLETIGKLREAIDLAELAMVDHFHSSLLRDRLAALRSRRELQFQNDWRRAEEALDQGDRVLTRTILKEIESYGDAEMLEQVRARHADLGKPVPAVYKAPSARD